MRITYDMDINALAERMGGEPNIDAVHAMRVMLGDRFNGADTDVIPDADWLAMLEEAAERDPKSADISVVRDWKPA